MKTHKPKSATFFSTSGTFKLMCFHIKTRSIYQRLTPFFQHGPLSRTRFSLMLVSFFTRRARDKFERTVVIELISHFRPVALVAVVLPPQAAPCHVNCAECTSI